MRKFNIDTDNSTITSIKSLEDEVKEIIYQFGNAVAKKRAEKKLTLQELSTKSGVSIAVISDLEKGKNKIPNLYTFVALAKTLEIDKDYFIKLVFGNIVNKKICKKSSSDMLVDALVAYGVPIDVAANILVGIDLSYGKHSNK